MRTFYAGLDVGSSICELVVVNDQGHVVHQRRLRTGQRVLLEEVRDVRKRLRGDLHLTFEEGEMAQWLVGFLRSEVDRLVVCEPKRNAWIAKDSHKDDAIDAAKLANLFRGGFLQEVYHPAEEDRAEFKRVVQHYHKVTVEQAGLKTTIKSRLRSYGVIVRGMQVFHKTTRDSVITLVPSQFGQQIVRHLFLMLDTAEQAQLRAKRLMEAVGSKFEEVARFKEVPGIGSIWACTFSAYVQTPWRFRTKRQLWRFSGLALTSRSSNGEKLSKPRLDRAGVGMLKRLSYHAFLANMGGKKDFRTHYEACLDRTGDKTHARLTTQRRILATLLAMWKRGERYRPLEASPKVLKGKNTRKVKKQLA